MESDKEQSGVNVEQTMGKAKVKSSNFQGMNSAKNLDELVQHYDKFAPNYDQEVSQYGHKKHLVAEEVAKIVGDRRDVKILDVAAGTGISGAMLKNAGFTNIDALDASQEMLNVAKQKDIYTDFICTFVLPKENSLPIETGTYDILTLVGAVGANHIKEDCFKELTRILKPGGSMVNITPVHAMGSEMESFEKAMRQYHEDNVLLWVDTIHVPVYYNGCDGVMHVFKKPE